MRPLTTLRTVALIGAMACGVAACSSNPLLPYEPEISAAPDNFQLQATGVTNVTSTQTYSWANTGTRAKINHSTVTTGGSALLTVRDGAGMTVYTQTLAPSLSEATAVGGAGTWTIVVTLTSYSGTLNFRAEKL
jgi:hypothetical protein